MEVLRKQVEALSDKIDTLQAVIECLPDRISEAVEVQIAAQATDEPDGAPASSRLPLATRVPSSVRPLQSSLEHKDVLVDEVPAGRYSTGSERELAPEIQLQRLTAQLTAAYNRIAALEEQLLSHRIPQ